MYLLKSQTTRWFNFTSKDVKNEREMKLKGICKISLSIWHLGKTSLEESETRYLVTSEAVTWSKWIWHAYTRYKILSWNATCLIFNKHHISEICEFSSWSAWTCKHLVAIHFLVTVWYWNIKWAVCLAAAWLRGSVFEAKTPTDA